MLFSHRCHAPAPETRLALHRVIAPTWVSRRVRLEGVAHDEALTRALGKGTKDDRARLTLVLAGRLEVSVDERHFDLGPGDLLLVPRAADVISRGGDDDVLEIDWDAASPIAARRVSSFEHGRLSEAALTSAATFASELSLRGRAPSHLASAATSLSRALAAAGLPVDPSGVDGELTAPVAPAEQRLFDAIDDTLTDLSAGPAVIELEDKLGWSRRTVSRRTRELHARYGLSGTGSVTWRAVRDFYRVLVGVVIASSPALDTRRLAQALGYSSPDALCHAFANAGVPSPGSIAKTRSARHAA